MAEDHGHSTANWTGVGIFLVGSALICLGIVFAEMLLWAPGIVLLVVAVVAWRVLDKSGRGVHAASRSEGTGAVR